MTRAERITKLRACAVEAASARAARDMAQASTRRPSSAQVGAVVREQILEALDGEAFCTVAELAAHLEVCERTVWRHITALGDRLDETTAPGERGRPARAFRVRR